MKWSGKWGKALVFGSVVAVSLQLGMTHADAAEQSGISNESWTEQQSLVEVQGLEIPLLGELHLGVLDEHSSANGENVSEAEGTPEGEQPGTGSEAVVEKAEGSSSVVELELVDSLLGDKVHAGVLDEHSTVNGETISEAEGIPEGEQPGTGSEAEVEQTEASSSVVELELIDSLLGDKVHAGVLDEHSSANGETASEAEGTPEGEQPGTGSVAVVEQTEASSSVVELELVDSLLGDKVHAGVLDEHSSANGETASEVEGKTEGEQPGTGSEAVVENTEASSSVVELELVDSLLGDKVHAGVLDEHTTTSTGSGSTDGNNGTTASENSSLAKLDLIGSLLGDVHVGLLENNRSANEQNGESSSKSSLLGVDLKNSILPLDLSLGLLTRQTAATLPIEDTGSVPKPDGSVPGEGDPQTPGNGNTGSEEPGNSVPPLTEEQPAPDTGGGTGSIPDNENGGGNSNAGPTDAENPDQDHSHGGINPGDTGAATPESNSDTGMLPGGTITGIVTDSTSGSMIQEEERNDDPNGVTGTDNSAEAAWPDNNHYSNIHTALADDLGDTADLSVTPLTQSMSSDVSSQLNGLELAAAGEMQGLTLAGNHEFPRTGNTVDATMLIALAFMLISIGGGMAVASKAMRKS